MDMSCDEPADLMAREQRSLFTSLDVNFGNIIKLSFVVLFFFFRLPVIHTLSLLNFYLLMKHKITSTKQWQHHLRVSRQLKYSSALT